MVSGIGGALPRRRYRTTGRRSPAAAARIAIHDLSLASSQGCLKGAFCQANDLMTGRLPALAPFRPVFNDPVGQCSLKSDIPPGLFRLYPLVFQDLLTFRLE